jgi:hypothetical protein
MEITRDQATVQRIAESLWNVATSDNHSLASSRSTVYRHLEIALIGALREVYGLSELKARRVRDQLAEYGPDDSLRGTTGRGINSYVQFVKANRQSFSYDR